jgi:electron transfer flavoprotein beta subunit
MSPSHSTSSPASVQRSASDSRSALRLVVLVKQVPDTANVTGEAMKEDGTVNRAALPAIFNPEDLTALEEALRLRDRFGGRVSVVTMGPPAAARVLRESLFRGADEVVLLTDRKFAGADTLATSYSLALAVRKLGDVDLVLCGRQAIDGDTAQVGPQVAEKLGLPQITCVSRIDEVVPQGAAAKGDRPGGSVTATRSIEGGFQTLRAPLPALLTVVGEANEPRPPSAKLVLTYKGAEAEAWPDYDDSYLDPESEESQVCMIGRDGRPVCRARIVLWDAAALGAEDDRTGLRGSPTRVKEIESVVLSQADARMVEPTDEGVTTLVKELIAEHILG